MTRRGSQRGRGRRTGVRLPKRVPRDLSAPLEWLRFPVEDPAEEGARLDRYLLARLPWRSRTSIVALLGEEKVRLNGEVVTKKATRLRPGDLVEVEVPPPEEEVRHEALARELEGAILFEDDHLLAVAKPAGLVVHPVGRLRANTLIQGLHWLVRHGRPQRPGIEPPILRICHRLDRDTSGVVALAKTAPARSAMGILFEERDQAEKEYVAVVHGRVEQDAGEIDLPLGPDEEAEIELMMTVREDGVPARTSFRVEERFAAATRVRFTIHTGRQHQIRVHARALGHPILCDALYGRGELRWPPAGAGEGAPVIARQALHAARLAFPHPITGEALQLEAPLPADMEALLAALRPECPDTEVLRPIS